MIFIILGRFATPVILQFPVTFRPYLHPITHRGTPLRLPVACNLLPVGMVVEPSPIRSLVADCPIFIIFKHSHLGLFHPYVVVNESLRVFQQFNVILNLHYCKFRTLVINPALNSLLYITKTILLTYQHNHPRHLLLVAIQYILHIYQNGLFSI